MLLSGESLVGHLKIKLVAWMGLLLGGPWDEAYYNLRCKIGRVHVRIGLAQHYMFGAMNVLRDELKGVVENTYRGDPETLLLTHRSIGKISISSLPSCCTPIARTWVGQLVTPA